MSLKDEMSCTVNHPKFYHPSGDPELIEPIPLYCQNCAPNPVPKNARVTGHWDSTISEDAERLRVIRDSFIEGRDVDAVAMMFQTLQDGLNKYRVRRVLGVSSNSLISPDSYFQVFVRPQIPFKVNRILIPGSIADRFLIHDLRVGNRSQTVAVGDIPAELMSTDMDEIFSLKVDNSGFGTININDTIEARFGLPIDMEACQIAQDLVIDGRNLSIIPTTFRAVFLGITPKY